MILYYFNVKSSYPINLYEIISSLLFFISDEVSPESTLLIVNALYFKASWHLVFDDGECAQFTNSNGKRTNVKMMTRDSRHQTAAMFSSSLVGDSIKFLAISIPYEVSPSQIILSS